MISEKTRATYQNNMVHFMSYLHGLVYDASATFSLAELAVVTPLDVTRWMCMRCYGTPEPLLDDRPIKCRASTLEVYKKSLSHFMPNKIATWDYIHKSGNPSRSNEVNDLVKHVRQEEVRKRGKAPCAKRALTQAEFRNILVFFFDKNDFQHRYRYSCMLLYQYYLIARCDDVGHFLIRDLHGHSDPRFSLFCLQTKVSWSKNVYEERDCPDQIFFGSFDSQYCLLLSLSIYLETWLGDTTSNTNKEYLFGDDSTDDIRSVERIKANYSTTLRKYFTVFVRLSKELGTHSIRKFAATWARRLGCLIDEIDARGRWKKGSRRIVDRYINIEQQYLDAKVAKALCVGGAIKYGLVKDSGITNAWLYEHVVPGIKDYFVDDSIIDVLALPLLYACLHNDLMHTVPLTISTRVRERYEVIRVLDVSTNPVKRIFIEVNRHQDELTIDEISDEDHEQTQRSMNGNNGDGNNNQYNMVLVHIRRMQETMATGFDQVNQSINNQRTEFGDKCRTINKNIGRILIQPPRMMTPQQRQDREARNNFHEAAAAALQPVLIAQLSKAPKTLFVLWEEYQFGMTGNKPAKDFTSFERGACRSVYCRRKVFWDCVSKHVHAGFFAVTAITKILDAYGHSNTVSTILVQMVKDKANGGHVNLRV